MMEQTDHEMDKPVSPANLKHRLSNGTKESSVSDCEDNTDEQKNGTGCNGSQGTVEDELGNLCNKESENEKGEHMTNGICDETDTATDIAVREGRSDEKERMKSCGNESDCVKEEPIIAQSAPSNSGDESSGKVSKFDDIEPSVPDKKKGKSESEGGQEKTELSDKAEKRKYVHADTIQLNNEQKKDVKKADQSASKVESVSNASKDKRKDCAKFKRHDSDDIQIVGESKVINVSGPYTLATPSQNVVFVPAAISSSISASFPMMNQGFSATNVMSHNMSQHSPRLSSGFGLPRNPHPSMSQSPSLMMGPIVAPPQPKSSLDQIELIRWEIHNRINTRPKYFKPSPATELGPLAKFLFDIGSDMIKETVYHELVKIQSKKGEEDKLSEKEKEDLNKLKEIEKDLISTIGHLKLKMKKRCKTCNFQTESTNVLYLHKQFPHELDKRLHCAHCNFVSKQPMGFKFHMQTEHNIQPRVYDKKAFFECDMCPYENNQEQKVVVHKTRCVKQFRPLFNLHPSCLSGAEINLCLENIFYKSIIPKNLRLLQQKVAQQQAALQEAKRQQVQIQALAAQKNAAAAAKKLQPQQQHNRQSIMAPKANMNNRRMPMGKFVRVPLPKVPMPPVPVRNNSAKVNRPTVANMLNNRQNLQTRPPPPQAAGPAPPGGFEVCEICGGYVKDRKALRIHFFYAHRIDLPFNLFERTQAPLYCATCYVRFWTAQGLRKHIDTHKEENITQGVVGKCISCGHHVLNLLIHMRIVHNREIQHYVNALMCMFCGSHFNTRNDVERHMKFVHGTVDTLTGAIKAPSGGSHHLTPPAPAKGGSSKKASGSGGGSAVKGSVCVLCNLNFGRNVDLTRHCMRMHHTCMKCGMVVIDKASLMKHTCLASPSGTRDCTMCFEKAFHPAYYVKHLRDKHLKKFTIKIARVSKQAIEKWTKRPYPFKEQEHVLVEISDSDDETPLKDSKTETNSSNRNPTKKVKIGPASFMKRLSAKEQNENKAAGVVNTDDMGNVEPTSENKVGVCQKSDSNTVVKNVLESKDAADELVENVGADELPENEGADEMPENIGADELPENVGADEMPENIGADELPENVGADELPENVGADEFPENVGADEFPENVGADEFPENVGADEFPENVGADEFPENVGADEFPENVGADELAENVGADELAENVGADELAENVGEESEKLKVKENAEAEEEVDGKKRKRSSDSPPPDKSLKRKRSN